MRKKMVLMIFGFIFCSLLIMFTALGVQAEDIEEVNSYLGVSYNTYCLSEFQRINREDYDVDEEINRGFSFYGGAEYDLSEAGIQNWKAGAEIEYMQVQYSELDLSLSNLGLLVTGSYQLDGIDEGLPETFSLAGGAGLYRAHLMDREVDQGVKDEIFVGPGFKLGLKGGYPVYQNINLGGRVFYRYARPHSEGDLNFSGLEAGAYLNANF